jgi:hypothetical protein
MSGSLKAFDTLPRSFCKRLKKQFLFFKPFYPLMENVVYLTHKGQALGQTWFDISLEPETCQDIGTPFVPIDQSYLEKIASTYYGCKSVEDLKRLAGSSLGRFDDNDTLLWKQHIAIPYEMNLRKTKVIDIPSNKDSGVIADISWLKKGDINIGGCYMDYCLLNTINSLRPKITSDRRIYIVPELTVCFEQPGNATFLRILKKLNDSSFSDIEIKHLCEL